MSHPYRTLAIPPLPKEPSTKWCERCINSSPGWSGYDDFYCQYDDYPPHCPGPYLRPEYKDPIDAPKIPL